VEPAKLLFTEILSDMGLEEGRVLNREEERLLVSRVLALLGVHPQLRDECYVQLQKQTRNNPHRSVSRRNQKTGGGGGRSRGGEGRVHIQYCTVRVLCSMSIHVYCTSGHVKERMG